MLNNIIEEIKYSLSKGYLSDIQVQILNARLFQKKTYREILSLFNLSCFNVLVHCFKRTAQLEYWINRMDGEGTSYLSEFDNEVFIEIIGNAADDSNCLPVVYAISLAHHLKKKRVAKAVFLLNEMQNSDLASQLTGVLPPSSSWIYNSVKDTEFHIVSGQQIEFSRRINCDAQKVFFYFLIHSFILQRHPCLIINMDETMLNAKRRLKVLAKKGRLPLIPEAVKVPHLTGCVAFTASGHLFDPLILLPNKKTLRTLEEFDGGAYFGSSSAGWMTKDLFTYFCIILICQISHYRLTLPEKLQNERFLLIVDGHKSRENFNALCLLYLFGIDILLLPPHCSHLMQPFDVSLASPLKIYFKEELSNDECNLYFTKNGLVKQSAQDLRKSLINAFLNGLRKSATKKNIESGFSQSGIFPLNPDIPLSSEFAMNSQSDEITQDRYNELLKNYWLNSEEGLKEQFYKENGRDMTEDDFDVSIRSVLNDIRNSKIESGLALSDVPPLFIEEQFIQKVNINQ